MVLAPDRPANYTPTPAPPELIARAGELVKAHPECFWFRHPEARIRYLEDVHVVIAHLREYGNRRTWLEAQELQRCLSHRSSAAS